ncbi:CNGA4 protein, partial [Leptocoma aspasia]|nr:CNGA4 protein [Leptocoma aspasia]
GFLEDGILVQDVSRTRRRYLGSWTFPWDVMAVLPTELLCLLPGVPRVPGVPAARANRCLRVPRLFEAFDRCETRTGWPNAFRMAKLMLYLLLGIHWHGCLYFALSARLGLGADPWVCPSSTRLLRRYLLCGASGCSAAGSTACCGSWCCACGHRSSAPASSCAGAGTWAARCTSSARAAWPWWPRTVSRSWPCWARGSTSGRSASSTSRHGVLRQLVLRLRPQVFGPGEFVCRRGDVGREMYFIREGRLAVVAEDGVTQLAVLGEGLYFGEISLINIKGELHAAPCCCPAPPPGLTAPCPTGNTAGNRRTANILSIGYSDLFCLGKEDLAEVLAEFPCARAAMEAKGRELLLRMGQLNTGAEAAALAAEAKAEQRLQGLEVALEGLQTRAARLLAQLEASALRMALRVRRLEGR